MVLREPSQKTRLSIYRLLDVPIPLWVVTKRMRSLIQAIKMSSPAGSELSLRDKVQSSDIRVGFKVGKYLFNF